MSLSSANIHRTMKRVEAGWPNDTRRYFHPAGKILLLLVLTFITLVPGGPIETRSVTGLGGPVFWGFNAFLVPLAIGAKQIGMDRGNPQ